MNDGVKKRNVRGLVSIGLLLGLILPAYGFVLMSMPASGGGTVLFSDTVPPGDTKWIYEGAWHVTSKKYYSSSYSIWYGFEDTNNYDAKDANGNSTRTMGNLTLKNPIDLQAVQKAYLSFYYYLDIETTRDPTGWEWAEVSVSVDGKKTWQVVANLTDTNGEWRYELIDLTNIGKGHVLYIRFYFDSVDGYDNDYWGWFLDDIKVFTGSDDFGFVQYDNGGPVVTQIYDIESGGSARAIQYYGYIRFQSDEKLRGVDLGSAYTDFVMRPGGTVTITTWIANFNDEMPATILYGIKIYNRFGVEVHSDSKQITIGAGVTADSSFTWSTDVPDQYIVVAYVSQPGNVPTINLDTLQETSHIRYRILKVYEPLLWDPVEAQGSDQQSAEWTADDTGTGDFRIEDDYHHSSPSCWHGGDVGIISLSGTQSIESKPIDGSELYWVYRTETPNYPKQIRTTASGRIGLYFSFYYLYSMNNLGAGDWGELLITTSYDNGSSWTDPTRVWDTSDASNPHIFDPEQKDTWTDDYTNDVPTIIDITGHLPNEYTPGFQMKFIFRVHLNYIGASLGWFIDDISLCAIIPRFNMSIEDVNSPLQVTDDPQQVAPFMFTVDTEGTNYQTTITVETTAYLPGTQTDPWQRKISPSEMVVRGGDSMPVSYTLTTNDTPEQNIYQFPVWVNMSVPGKGIITGEELTLILKVGPKGITINVDQYEKSAGPGETVSYNITITNGKDVVVDIYVSYSPENLPAGWNATLENTVISNVDPSETVYTHFNVTTPPQASSGEYLAITITARNDLDPATADSDSLVVNTTVIGKYKVNLTASPDTIQVKPGSTGDIPLVVKNTGNLGGTVVLSITDAPPELGFGVSVVPDQMYLDAFQTGGGSVKASVPEDTPEGLYAVKVSATIENMYTAEITVYFNVTEPYIIDIVPITQTQNTTYNIYTGGYEPVVFQADVYNNGSRETSITFSASGDAADWVTVPSDTPLVNKTINNPQAISISVAVPQDTVAGEYHFTLNATAVGDVAVYDTETFTIVVEEYHEIHLSTTTSSLEGEPDSNQTITISISNNGNTEETLTLATDMGAGWEYSFENGETTMTVTLSAFSTTSVDLTIQPTMAVEAGTYTINITGTSTNATDVSDTLQITFTVSAVYGIDLVGGTTDVTYNPAGAESTAAFTFQLKNTGNKYDDVGLTAQVYYAGVRKTEYDEWVTIKHNGAEVVGNLRINPGETFDMTVDVSPQNALAGDYTINILASDAHGASDSLSLTLHITAIHDISVGVDKNAITLLQGGTTTVSVEITNSGNTNEIVTIDVESVGGGQDSWVTYPSPITVSPGESTTVTITIMLPDDAKPGTYTFTVHASTNETQDTTSFDVKVVSTGVTLFGMTQTEIGIIVLVIVIVVLLLAMVSRGRKPQTPQPQRAPGPGTAPVEEERAAPDSGIRI